jgi:hypothetical protein
MGFVYGCLLIYSFTGVLTGVFSGVLFWSRDFNWSSHLSASSAYFMSRLISGDLLYIPQLSDELKKEFFFGVTSYKIALISGSWLRLSSNLLP